MRRNPAILAAAATGFGSSADAHLVNTRLGDFYGGMLHPLTGFEYLLPWLALVILAILQGPRAARWLFLTFPLGLTFGTILSIMLPHAAFIPVLNVVLTAGLGLLVASAANLSFPLFLAIGAMTGIAQGYDNGSAITFDTDRLLFISGVTAAGYAFAALTIGLGTVFLDGGGGWRSIALRAGGSWIAAVGIMVLSLELVRAAG